jgi:hypothetical protein
MGCVVFSTPGTTAIVTMRLQPDNFCFIKHTSKYRHQCHCRSKPCLRACDSQTSTQVDMWIDPDKCRYLSETDSFPGPNSQASVLY